MNLSQTAEKCQRGISSFQRRQRNKQEYIVKLGHKYFQDIEASRLGFYAVWSESQLQAAPLNRKDAYDYAAYLQADIYRMDDEGYEVLVQAYREPSEDACRGNTIVHADGWAFVSDERMKELHDIERDYYRIKRELEAFTQSLRGERS